MNPSKLSHTNQGFSRFKVPDASPYTPGGFWRRFAASFVDGFVMTLINVTSQITLEDRFLDRLAKDSPMKVWILSYLIGMIFAGIYAGYFYSRHGATPGKLLFKLTVFNVRTGSRPSFGDGFFRDGVFKLLSLIPLGLGYLMVVFRSDKRALHDLLAQTQVFKRQSDSRTSDGRTIKGS